ncbi:MAG TPA: DUF2877 domain-containing protein [Candidatus Ozemobacteraceae bacterium]|nr:DUF2877 domain-containing protein [Candidatus Ozemobacteraceae bacterium]
MTTNPPLFGRIISLDQLLKPATDEPRKLSLRGRGDCELYFLTPDQHLVTVAPYAWGRGPNRILVEQLPDPTEMLIAEGWRLTDQELRLPTGDVLPIDKSRWHLNSLLEPVKEFPGHLRNALNRLQKRFSLELDTRMQNLAQALKTPLAESVELPLLQVIGFGDGNHPDGDAALCGLLLTGRAISLGKRLKVHWLPRLVPETRRFLHRTPKISASLIRFALEGRITERQERFFTAMGRDYESAVEAALANLLDGPERGSLAFLTGVKTALEMIRQDMELVQSRPTPRSTAVRPDKN